MHEVECGLAEVIFDDVVPQDVKVGQRQRSQMPDVYIGSNDPPTWADPVGQPSRDRAAAAATSRHRQLSTGPSASTWRFVPASKIAASASKRPEASGFALSRT